jgi:hypothetical protein
MRASGKRADTPEDTEAALADPEIATDAALVFLAGWAAERQYCQQNGTTADVSLSQNDYHEARRVLRAANVQTSMSDLDFRAEEQVKRLWNAISEFAEALHEVKSVDAADAYDFISQRVVK